ncbi:MAG: radical SAM protein [Nannocystaceae bacterium]|nr:radical SAM protein [Nannocystaceae bacterium]
METTTLRRGLPTVTDPDARRGGTLDVALVLTHACNLACAYCYTGEKKRVRMSTDVARRGLSAALSTAAAAGARLQLSFFGGEPLLEHELLLAIAAEARARSQAEGIALVQQVTTNGTLLTEALVEQLATHAVHVAISLDGGPAQHDALRPLAGGGASWPASHRGLELLLARRERTPFDVIAVVDPRTVDALGDGVRALLDEGVDALTLNINVGSPWSESELERLERQLELIAALQLAWLRRGRWVRIQPFEAALRSIASSGRVEPSSCSAGVRRLAIAPSGRIYGCARAVGEDTGARALGHLDEGLPAPRALGPGCACASAEESGDPTVAGPAQLRHDRIVAQVAARLAARLAAEYELIHIVERGAAP